MSDHKATLLRYLDAGRDAVLWKLEGLSEYDARRPLTPTGSNVLGIVKHLAAVDVGYLGDCFGRPFPEPLPWFSHDAEPNADMWATADESRESIVALYGRARAHGDATVAALDLDAPGRVPWWTGRAEVTLQQILVHLLAETHRHAGQVDVLREMVDGSAGLRDGGSNLPDVDEAWWAAYRDRLEQTARQVGGV